MVDVGTTSAGIGTAVKGDATIENEESEKTEELKRGMLCA